jgi:hypothetical protein
MEQLRSNGDKRESVMSTTRDEHERTFLNKNNDFVERMARYYMLDSVACEMHNEGYSLDGNTEKSDLRWFARLIYDHDRRGSLPRFGDVDDATLDRYLKLAETCLKAIPALMSRMSARCIRISQAVNTIIKAEKLHEEYERIKKQPGMPG